MVGFSLGFCLLCLINFDLFSTRAGKLAEERNLNKIVSFHVLESRVAAVGVDTRLLENKCGEERRPPQNGNKIKSLRWQHDFSRSHPLIYLGKMAQSVW